VHWPVCAHKPTRSNAGRGCATQSHMSPVCPRVHRHAPQPTAGWASQPQNPAHTSHGLGMPPMLCRCRDCKHMWATQQPCLLPWLCCCVSDPLHLQLLVRMAAADGLWHKAAAAGCRSAPRLRNNQACLDLCAPPVFKACHACCAQECTGECTASAQETSTTRQAPNRQHQRPPRGPNPHPHRCKMGQARATHISFCSAAAQPMGQGHGCKAAKQTPPGALRRGVVVADP
jgi:hypothetical protein